MAYHVTDQIEEWWLLCSVVADTSNAEEVEDGQPAETEDGYIT